MPRSEQNEAKSREVKLEPWSHLILLGIPCSVNTSSIRRIVVSESNLSEFLQ